MDALAELRARLHKTAVEETCGTCLVRGSHQFGCPEETEEEHLEERPHANCRQKPCPYCKALRDADAGDATGSMSEDEERASADWAR